LYKTVTEQYFDVCICGRTSEFLPFGINMCNEWIFFKHAAPTFCANVMLDTHIYSAGKKPTSSFMYARRQSNF
jgi:hypothetical protein